MGINKREFTVNRDKIDLKGEIYFKKDFFGYPDKKRCIIISHGFGENRMGYKKLAKFFASHNLAAVLFDFAGASGGDSGGDIYNKSVLTEVEDLKTIINLIQSSQRFDEINLLGFSEGGIVSALAAAETKEIKNLVLFYPAFVIPDFVRGEYPDRDLIPEKGFVLEIPVGKRYFDDLYDLDFYETVSKGILHPTLIFHGTKDQLVPIECSRKIKKLNPMVQLIEIQGQGHGFKRPIYEQTQKTALDFIYKTNTSE